MLSLVKEIAPLFFLNIISYSMTLNVIKSKT